MYIYIYVYIYICIYICIYIYMYIYICIYIYMIVCLVRAYSVYIHPAPFVRDAIFPYCMLLGSVHCCSRDKTSKTERLNSVGSQQGLEHGEERGAQLSRRKLIISVLRDTAANGQCIY